MNRLKIAFLAGGDSSEREIALQSAAQIEAALDPGKYDVTVIDVRGRDWHYTAPDGRRWQLDRNDFSLTVDGCRREFDYALILIHGTPGEDGKLQGYLDIMGIPYSSCSMTSSVITFDKISTKRAVAATGVGLARERFIRRGDAVDPDALAAELHRLALAAYKACRCRGIVRVDFIVTPEGRPYLIEINTIPGMSAGSIVPKQVRAAGMTLGELYDLIIADTCGRKP